MPMGVERIFEAEWLVQQSAGEQVDVRLKSDIEGIVIKWATQINDILSEESTLAFNNNNHPLPSTGNAGSEPRKLIECFHN